MTMPHPLTTLARFYLVLSITCWKVEASRNVSHFQDWYPGAASYRHTLESNCSAQYDYYLGKTDEFSVPHMGSSWRINQVLNCLLENTPESPKANMAAAAVTMGLLPTALSLVASTILETGIIALRRPLLALLLSAASPAVGHIAYTDYRKIASVLQDSVRLGTQDRRPPPYRMAMVTALENTVVTAAFINNAHNTYQLCRCVVFSFAPEISFAPVLYAIAAMVLHLLGTWALYLRVQLLPTTPEQKRPFRKSLVARIKHELTPCMYQPDAILEVAHYDSIPFLSVSWCTSIGVLLYIVYGTFMFSSALFITLSDSLIVAARFLASIIACRAVLVYELRGMNARVMEVGKGDRNVEVETFVDRRTINAK